MIRQRGGGPLRKLDDAQAAEVRRLRDEGWTLKRIAEHVGCSIYCVWCCVMGDGAYAGPYRGDAYLYPRSYHRRARQMREQGWKLREIASELGVSTGAVRKWLAAEERSSA